jgi:hypothetical protein
MSYGSLILINNEGKVDEEIEFRNGHGMGPAIWARIAKANGKDHWMFWMSGDLKGLVAGLPEVQQNVMNLTTWEPTLVAQEHWEEVIGNILDVFEVPRTNNLAADIVKFEERESQSKYVNHWPKICVELFERKDGEALLAFGIYNTSVNDSWQYGPYNEETEDHDPFDAFTMSWWLTPGEGRAPHPRASG